jgi:hypothetical protein
MITSRFNRAYKRATACYLSDLFIFSEKSIFNILLVRTCIFCFKIFKKVVNPWNTIVNKFGEGCGYTRIAEEKLEKMQSYRIVQIAVNVPAPFE